jgi:hypothetical protein
LKITFLTYCTENYLKSAKKLVKSAKNYGLNNIDFFTREDLIKTDFYSDNRTILDLPQRAGCSLWKIYYIHQEYFKLKEGEILFYADAGSKLIADPKPLIDLCFEKDIVLFNLNNNPLNRHWCKRDSFVYMDCDVNKHHDAPHYNAAFQLYKRTKNNDAFISEMLAFGTNINIISDLPNVSGKDDLSDFVEHRFDQSILSILGTKYNIEQHRYPAQWGNHMKLEMYRKKNEWLAEPYLPSPLSNSMYPTIFDHHRNKTSIEVIAKLEWWKNKYLTFKHTLKQGLIKLSLWK